MTSWSILAPADNTRIPNLKNIGVTPTHRYPGEYALERLRLLVLGLVALEDALDVRTEDTLVCVELLQLPAEPGVEGVRRNRH